MMALAAWLACVWRRWVLHRLLLRCARVCIVVLHRCARMRAKHQPMNQRPLRSCVAAAWHGASPGRLAWLRCVCMRMQHSDPCCYSRSA
jgi:hypothetical protein